MTHDLFLLDVTKYTINTFIFLVQKILLKGENSATSQRLSVLAKPACRDGGTARNPTVVSSSTTEDAEETETTSRPSQPVSGGVDEEENVSDFKINIFNAGEHLLNHLIYPNDIRVGIQ